MTPLETALTEIEKRQASREQSPTAVTTTDCRRLLAALRYAMLGVTHSLSVSQMRAAPEKIAAILLGDAP